MDLFIYYGMDFPVARTVKCLPTMRETQVRSLGWEYPLEKEMATHSSTLAWKIPISYPLPQLSETPKGERSSKLLSALNSHKDR